VSGLLVTLAACTAASPVATPSGAQTGTPGATATASPSAAATLTIPITIANQKVDPSGKKIDVAQGTTIILTVSSDMDDEVHAHTAGDGYELEVTAGKPVQGSFVASDIGSFEIESHHLNKVIVILNVR
jgi:hypothetical protein